MESKLAAVPSFRTFSFRLLKYTVWLGILDASPTSTSAILAYASPTGWLRARAWRLQVSLLSSRSTSYELLFHLLILHESCSLRLTSIQASSASEMGLQILSCPASRCCLFSAPLLAFTDLCSCLALQMRFPGAEIVYGTRSTNSCLRDSQPLVALGQLLLGFLPLRASLC